VYLDTDAVLARLKVEDWLRSFVSPDVLESPVTSTATAIEVQYVMGDEWELDRLTEVSERIADEGIELSPLTRENVEASEELRGRYDALGVFDSIHLGVAWTNDEPTLSTDTLYPDIDEVEHIDPRDLG
jgi:hypothetical protein